MTACPTPTRRSVLAGLAGVAGAAGLAAAPARAQTWPERPISLVVPFAPGGSTDILARIVSDHLRQSLGQPVVIENRTGASGNVGAAFVARAAPDGHTILFNTMSVHTMNHALFASMPFDGVKDFAPIGLLAYVTNTVVVHPSVPATTIPELIAYAKANPGKVTYASAGYGSTNHLSAALFEKMAGVEMLHVPYRGGAPAVVDTVAGQTQVFFTAGTQSLEHVKVGKLRLLAVTEARRSALLPDVPTVAETLPGYEMSVWYGAYGPAGMSSSVVSQLNAELGRILFLPDVRKRMEDLAVEVARSTPDELGAMTVADADKWGRTIRELGIKLQ
ncbi:tripartite tricarboxylate transporter substrate binding protein [Rhodoplanes sp. TEM]|uniref:Tripartite tricarboxylate transporter substrate binding protein n=1 Tax=Rhodoplanes tepidamans TaxID=200616 RepID=A0ABT5JAY7_RHOTP|nr:MULTISPECIES: tripartite tricarboxylate transporter substrate binding protein [Rhodoplanes]MDC7786603.1 tripartite tricarboxylate transporter substrate binding protein [Rhodoplanes tepidamans]MDC7983050.1 tripartite tricarboxylate transporter substrate binding protein [Rhodoplanes sp. TEM]MDQ0356432.1 tripartite-type tricarboxylate transporter receptor subunit TctC [Rhodoplanes tepidamans]